MGNAWDNGDRFNGQSVMFCTNGKVDPDIEPDPIKSQWMTTALKDAYVNGDFSFVNDSINKTKHDLNPIADLLENHPDNAFNVVKDDSGHDVSVINAASATLFVSVREDAAAREADRKAGKEQPNAVYKPTT